MHAIESELLEVTGLKKKPKEPRSAFLARLVAFDMNEKWDTLSAEAQAWLNDATKADNDDRAIPDFPDAEDDAASEPESEAAEEAASEEDEEKVSKKPAKKAAKKAAKAGNGKGDEPTKVAKRKPRAVGALREGLEVQIKRMILKKPSISAEDLIGQLAKSKVKASKFTVVAIRSGFRHSIRVLDEAGLIKGKIDL